MPGTRCINYAELKSLVEKKGAESASRWLTECLEPADGSKPLLAPSDFSIRELAEAFMGSEWVANLSPKSGRLTRLQESSGSAVAFSQFSNITGQIFFTEVKKAYDSEELVFKSVVPTLNSDLADMEKIPGFGDMGDDFETVGENRPFPELGVSEDYFEVGPKQKRGGIVSVTKEAVRFDRTSQLLERCRKGGMFLGLNVEKRVIDAIIDENAGAASAAAGGHRYHWKGTSYATYQTATPWINVQTSNELVDWTDVQASWGVLAEITDPYTGEPILITPDSLIVTTDYLWAAMRIVNHTMARSGDITTGAGHQMETTNVIKLVLGNGLRVLSSRLLTARAATDTDWWLGNPSEAFARYANWDITPEEEGANSPSAFERDVVARYKVSVRDIVGTREPRVMCENRQ